MSGKTALTISVTGQDGAYGMHASNWILFNQESPLRGGTSVPPKITWGVAAITRGYQIHLRLGTLSAQQDGGNARDYVDENWCILPQDEPEDYVLAPGECQTVRDVVERFFEITGTSLEWDGNDVEKFDRRKRSGEAIIVFDPSHFRPTKVDFSQGCADKARDKLGWQPKISLDGLVAEMVEADLASARQAMKGTLHAEC